MVVTKQDPICIVGMACRLPGNICSPEDLWKFMVEQKTAQGPVPPERYNLEGFYHPYKDRSGSINVPGGYFVDEDVRQFDNNFFGINNLEATYMDPQQRKLLEVTFEALQSSGTTMSAISGSTTGVYVANFSVDYQPGQTRDPDYIHRYTATGSGATVMSNRISHIFNLLGPSFTVDTACSSSVYALHQALNAIKAGDCDSAIVASANLVLSPELHIGAAKSGVLSPTGASHTFDVSADGYGRAEGISAIHVKRLSAAIRDGNPIRAVIRGSAVNASGRTPGISLPSGEMQEVVMRKAYQNAGMDASGTDYVECHGTGTPVGDPIEVNAVGRFFKRGEGPPLLIGSVKTNVGHSEAASGLTSILKVAKALEVGKIPPTYGVVNLNPKLILKEANVKIATQVEDWPRDLRRGSINSFGYGGANAHVIVESLESYLGQHVVPSPYNGIRSNGAHSNGHHKAITNGHTNGHSNGRTNGHVNGHTNGHSHSEKEETSVFALPVSAASAYSLKPLVQQVTEAVSNCQDLATMQSIAHTLTNHRDHLRYRTFALASLDKSSAKARLLAEPAVLSSAAADPLPFGFVFTGQGAQYPGMAKELLAQDPKFRATIRGLDETLQALPSPYAPSWTLEQTLLDDANVSRINEVTHSQPICTAVQIGLVDILRGWGVRPASVVGHSSGEIGAAYAAGLLTATQAILVAYFRGFAVGELRSKGCMMAAGLGPAAAQALIQEKGLQTQVRVACVNAPESVTLSGSAAAIDALEAELQRQSKFARKLVTGGRAYHSHMMEEIGRLYEDLLRPVFHNKSKAELAASAAAESGVKMYSSVGHSPEGLKVMTPHSVGPAYWRQNLEQPVQFSAALTKLAQDGKKTHLIEIGPHAALKGPIEQIRKAIGMDAKNLVYSSTLVRKEDASVRVQTLAGTLFANGHALKWNEVNGLPEDAGKLDLDSAIRTLPALTRYPWDYSGGLLWSEPRAAVELRNRSHIRHELLGTAGLAGNKIDFTWRNILKLGEMPWFRDHKVEDQIVFPAAGYIATAIEAVSQAAGIKKQLRGGQHDYGFELRNVSVIAALTVPEEKDAAGRDLELHTTLCRSKISGAHTSADWHDFSISSLFWVEGQTTLHCTGSIGVVQGKGKTAADASNVRVENTEGFDLWASTKRWYSKWEQEGLCFGPHFQSLTSLKTDSARRRREAIGTTRLEPDIKAGPYEFYPVHPITIDAAIQAACLSGCAGHVASLKVWLPVFISSCYIQPSSSGGGDAEGEVHVRCEEMGISSNRIDATIYDASGAPVVDLKDSRIALYTGKSAMAAAPTPEQKTEKANTDTEASFLDTPADVYTQRQPTLRVQWRPDPTRLYPDAAEKLRAYVTEFVARQHPDIRDDESMATIGALLALQGHKTPRMRVLELDGDAKGYKAAQWMNMLGRGTAFPLCRSWHAGHLDADGELSIKDGAEGPFDVVVIPRHSTFTAQDDSATQDLITSLVAPQGVVLARKSDVSEKDLRDAGFDVYDAGKQVLFAVRPVPATELQGRKALILTAANCSGIIAEFSKTLSAYLQKEAGVSDVKILAINEIHTVEVQESDICISLVETEKEFLATMTPEDMDNLRAVTNTANDLLWLTGANMLGQTPDPTLTLSSGLSRALMLEQPTLRWSVLDVGPASDHLADASKPHQVCGNIVAALVPRYDKDDCEFISVDHVLHVSRYGPDVETNSLFRQRLEPEDVKTEKRPLGELGPARLAISRPGATDTIHFQQLREPDSSKGQAPAGYVDIELRAVSLNAKDVYAMSGRVETREKTTGFDFSGVVTSVGAGSENSLKVGDRVVAYAPFHIGTTARVPTGCVHRLLDHEEFTVMPTLLLVYATALYALNDRAHLRAGESVLIHAGSGGVGVAAITLALNMGAVVYTTCGSPAKRDYLVNELGMDPSHIFSSRDASFVEGVLAATNGQGVDVILNSLVGDLLHDGWQGCLADFGRFVEIGKRDLLDAGKLDMRTFLRGVTFTAFDLSELFHSKVPAVRRVWDRLLGETLDLYRAGKIRAPPMKVFPATELAQAYRYFGNKDRVGKVVISLENPRARVPVAPAAYLSLFDPDKVYLLIGCLGGLGRSLSRWMVTRGARKFVFLGRSGADKPSARELVTRLERSGATVGVVRGDVSSAEDVKAAVAACVASGAQVGGVVQAAMGLHEALFTRMPNSAWHTGIDPKYQGTWNLHRALEGHDAALDFFLLTSSVSGTVGTATESNYCAANGFLDAFARYRRALGLPCVSVGLGMISEVGYLHENPEIEALLLRKGIQPLNEDEFLQIVDLALASEAAGKVEEAHLLTGLEPDAARQLIAQGFDVTTHGVLVEARSGILMASLKAEQEAADAASSRSQGAHTSAAQAAAPWFKDVPAALAAGFAPEAGAPSMQEAIVRLVKKRFSNLILLPLDQVDEGKPLADFGVDSMIASEFRSWFWAAFRVDLPFLDLMSPQKKLVTLAEFVEEKVTQSVAK
ncbi:hypothetical protein PG985_016313 [Apiospora marii]|uniref:uncharacterized protein n=1 Tax=Apiospora marii TaxID=335849 RepID=UPI00312F543B